jgi:hypothetical protein
LPNAFCPGHRWYSDQLRLRPFLGQTQNSFLSPQLPATGGRSSTAFCAVLLLSLWHADRALTAAADEIDNPARQWFVSVGCEYIVEAPA